MTDDPVEMAVQARRCRRLATHASGRIKDTLQILADDYDKRQLEAEHDILSGPALPPVT